jgi:putative transposase
MLSERTKAWSTEKKSIGYCESSGMLTAYKKREDRYWLNEVSSVPLQQALRHLQVSFRNFFEKRTGYPSFRSKRGRQSAEYTRSAFKWDAGNKNLRIAKLGRLRVRWSRTFASEPTTVTITKDPAGRYHVTLCLDEEFDQLPRTGREVGIDFGLARLATLSTGERIGAPRLFRRMEGKLAKAQRVLARRQKGSKRQERQRLRVARIQARVADARKDHLDKLTTRLTREHDLICVEDLSLRGMTRGLNLGKSVHDAGIGMAIRMLEWKATKWGKEVVRVDRFFPSSKTCSSCGYLLPLLGLGEREWDCPACGEHHDRDENAAKNILAAGRAASARGGDVRPAVASAVDGNLQRNANHFENSSKIRRPKAENVKSGPTSPGGKGEPSARKAGRA